MFRQFQLVGSGAPEISIVTDSIIGFGMIALGGCLHALTPKLAWVTDDCAFGLLAAFLAVPILLSRWQIGSGWLDLLPTVLAGALIVAVERRPASLAVRVLEAKPLVLLGRVSYGFYICHYWLTAEALYVMTMGLVDVRASPLSLQALVLFLATWMLAMLSWFLIEGPMLRVRNRLSARDRHYSRDDRVPENKNPPARSSGRAFAHQQRTTSAPG